MSKRTTAKEWVCLVTGVGLALAGGSLLFSVGSIGIFLIVLAIFVLGLVDTPTIERRRMR